MIATRRLRRKKLELTPIQLRVRREKNKLEEYINILVQGLSRRFDHFYGDADDMIDLLDVIDLHLRDAANRLKAAETYYDKVIGSRKTKMKLRRRKQGNRLNINKGTKGAN